MTGQPGAVPGKTYTAKLQSLRHRRSENASHIRDLFPDGLLGTAIRERGYGTRDQWAKSGAEMHWSPYLWLRGITGEQETNMESNHQRLVGVVQKGWR